LAGVMIYFAWVRGARRGDEHPSLLQTGTAMTYIAIVANLFGGFIRTYAPGHPSLTAIFDEPWVLIMAIKHLFLFGGMFAAVYLYEVVAPRVRRQVRENAVQPAGRKEAVAIAAVAMGILLATVLGAVSAVIDMGAADMPEVGGSSENEGPLADPNGILFEETVYPFGGQLTSLPPVEEAQSDGIFRLPQNVGKMQAIMTWDDEVAELDLTIMGPASGLDVKVVEAGKVTIKVIDPAAGEYEFVITGSNAIDVDWQLNVHVSPRDGQLERITDTVTVPPGTQVNFFEINTEMPLAGNMSWTWHAREGLPIAFNVHTHFDGEVQYLVEKTAVEDDGMITADRTGGYSLMWENTGAVPVRLTYEVWGNFVVESYFPATSSKLVG
jgi:hypothetical protein